MKEISVSVDADADCMFAVIPYANAYNPQGNLFQRGLDSYMPQSIFLPFFLGRMAPFTRKFDGDFFLDPGMGLAFWCKGVVPNPNPGNVTAPSPNANFYGLGYEVDYDAY